LAIHKQTNNISNSVIFTSPPKVIWEGCIATAMSENALHVLAVQCTTLWNCYRTLLKHYRSIMECCGALQKHSRTLQERYEAIVECCMHYENVTELLQRCYGVLRSVTEYYRALQDVSRRFGTLRKRCRSLRNHYEIYRLCPSL